MQVVLRRAATLSRKLVTLRSSIATTSPQLFNNAALSTRSVQEPFTLNNAHPATLSLVLSLVSRRLSVSSGGMAEQKAGEQEWREYLKQEEAREFDNSLFFEYEFSIDQLMEIAGLCVAQAIVRCYPVEVLGGGRPRVLLCCGPGNNGGDGLAAARHLLFFGYDPVIFYPKKTPKEIYQILVTQCEKLNIPFLDALPSAAEIDSQYHVVCDALFGFSFKGAARPPFDTVLDTLKRVTKPLASVDIPSGWDVEKGDTKGDGLKPDLLVSLTAPKECAKFFQGRYHYLGLRVIPSELATKFKVKLPTYPGTDQIVRIK